MLTFFDDFGRWRGPTFWINPETGEWHHVSSEDNRQGPSLSGLDKASGIESSLDVKAAAASLGCSQAQVRKLVHEGKLAHHWLGKNLRFRQQDLQQFWASQTRMGADKTSSKRLFKVRDRKRSETKERDSEALSLPTRREVDKLWR
jgi:excisionase family DNA binding protein